MKEILPKMVGRAIFGSHFENFWLTHFLRWARGSETRRQWLLALGLSWLGGLFTLGLVASASHFLSYFNAWTWMWGAARAEEPPVWIFLLAEASLKGLSFCALIGFVPAMVTGVGGWAWVFAPAALFPGILSLPGAWMMIAAERFALWLRASISVQDRLGRADLINRAIPSGIFLCVVAVFGVWLREWLRVLFPEMAFEPDSRFFAFALGLAFWTVAETLASMTWMHFRFAATDPSARPATRTLRLGRLLSPWDRQVLKRI